LVKTSLPGLVEGVNRRTGEIGLYPGQFRLGGVSIAGTDFAGTSSTGSM